MIKLTDEDRARYAPKKKQTNLEKIRAMSADELAGWLVHITDHCSSNGMCLECPLAFICNKEDLKNWLESEVEE